MRRWGAWVRSSSVPWFEPVLSMRYDDRISSHPVAACNGCTIIPHASINTRADERLPPEQRMQAIDRLEKDLGLTGQPRAVVVHEKEGREHCHVVWSRIDLDKMRTISDSHNFRSTSLWRAILNENLATPACRARMSNGRGRSGPNGRRATRTCSRRRGRVLVRSRPRSTSRRFGARPITGWPSPRHCRNPAGFWRVATGATLWRSIRRAGRTVWRGALRARRRRMCGRAGAVAALRGLCRAVKPTAID